MKRKLGLCVTLGILLGWQAGLAAEEDTVQAIIPWEADGRVFRVNTETLLYQGALHGVLYVESSSGDIHEAFVMCPVSQTIDAGSGESDATALCEISASAEDVAYAKMTCKGAAGDCAGSFELTGGVGRFAGIRGEGKLRVRSPVGVLISGAASGADMSVSSGIAVISDLRYRIP